MRIRLVRAYVFLAIAIPQCATALAVASTPPADLDKRVAAGRALIKSAHFSIKVIARNLQDPSHPSVSFPIDEWVDGRSVLELTNRGSARIAKAVHGDYFDYTTFATSSGAPSPVVCTDVRFVDRAHVSFHSPLKIMMTISGMDALETAPEILGSSHRHDVTTTQIRWNGEDAWKVQGGYDGSRISYVVVPRYEYSIVRFDVRSASNGVSSWEEASVAEVGRGIWFPREVRYEIQNSGSPVRDEKWSVTVSDVNKPIDASVFGPIGMHVPPGTPAVHVPRSDPREALKWDGIRLVQMTPAEISALNSSPSMLTRRRIRYGYIAIAILLIVCGLYISSKKGARKKA